MHSIKSKAYSSLGVLVAAHLVHPYSSPTATQHPARGMMSSRVTRGEVHVHDPTSKAQS